MAGCIVALASGLSSLACSHGRQPAPTASTTEALPPRLTPSASASASAAPEPEPATPTENATAYRATVGRGAALYIPPWFAVKRGGYDLIVHFHGVGRWQEANIEHAKLNVAVVSVNLGAGTEPYANGFRSPEAFERLLADTRAEIEKSGRSQSGAQLRRIALSAWSAGFSSVDRVLTDAVVQRVDAVLLADGFFTFFTEPRRRTVNAHALEKFAKFATAARRDEKLFAITHTTIPTGPYPSVQECVAKLLEMIDMTKTPAPSVGPRNMQQLYVVDRGSFHIRGFQGTLAADHVKQLHAMGETLYPYLKSRWDKQDEELVPPAVGGPPIPTTVARRPAVQGGAVTPIKGAR